MLRNVEPFEQVWKALRRSTPTANAVISFIRFLERRVGARMLYDTSALPGNSLELMDLFELAERMEAEGMLLSWNKAAHFPDEPPLALWNARYRTGDESYAAGVSVDDERHALTTALAETLERYLWFETSDYLAEPTVATSRQIARKGRHIGPESFAGFSPEQREKHEQLRILPESVFLWMRAESLVKKDRVYLPAQTICPRPEALRLLRKKIEPQIRRLVTTGLATHPVREEALLSGALEIIERDAYIIAWLNQLVLPRVSLPALAARRPSLKILLERCARYRLRPHIIRLITDAPTHAVCAVLEDESGVAPRIMFGLKAHRDLAYCAERAILEALRARRGTRNRLSSPELITPAKPQEVGHFDRLTYWADAQRDTKLDFFYSGPIEQPHEEPWEADNSPAHLERIVKWCAERGYEFATVPFTNSKKNIPHWHVEMTIIPQLQPLHYSEHLQHLGGSRLTDIPKQFGYKPRVPLYTEEPHPFA